MTANPMLGGEPLIRAALHDPLEDWPNDDLLLGEKERENFYLRRGRLAPIFDWPELREAFKVPEKSAGDARKRSRRRGVIAVALGFAGLALTALTPYFAKLSSDPELVERCIGGAAAVFIVSGTIVGFQQALIGQAKRRWLISRYWTERIRQFHFQLILNNLERAAAAVGDEAALDAWRTFRAGKFADFLHDAEQSLETAFDRLQDDHAEEDVWVDRASSQRPPTAAVTPKLAELLDGLGALRIGVQELYAHLKLKPGFYSPHTQAELLHGVSDAFTAAILLLTVAVGAVYVFEAVYVYGSEEPHLWRLWMLGLAGALTAAVVALRVLNEGLLLRTESERYRWYLWSVRSIRGRFEFEKANADERIRLLRELERLAYQEMRRFLVTSKEARFIM
jgi:hypothetical protein